MRNGVLKIPKFDAGVRNFRFVENKKRKRKQREEVEKAEENKKRERT